MQKTQIRMKKMLRMKRRHPLEQFGPVHAHQLEQFELEQPEQLELQQLELIEHRQLEH